MATKKSVNKSTPDGVAAGGSLRPAASPAPTGTSAASGAVDDGSAAVATGESPAAAAPALEMSPAPIATTSALRVCGPKQGRWRAGRLFGPEPVTLPVAELTAGEIDALQADASLVTVLVEMELDDDDHA